MIRDSLHYGDTDEGTMPCTYLHDEAGMKVFYAAQPASVTVTCDSCVTALYVTDHRMVALAVPHISTECYTGCLPCMVGSVAYGSAVMASEPVVLGSAGRHAA